MSSGSSSNDEEGDHNLSLQKQSNLKYANQGHDEVDCLKKSRKPSRDDNDDGSSTSSDEKTNLDKNESMNSSGNYF